MTCSAIAGEHLLQRRWKERLPTVSQDVEVCLHVCVDERGREREDGNGVGGSERPQEHIKALLLHLLV